MSATRTATTTETGEVETTPMVTETETEPSSGCGADEVNKDCEPVSNDPWQNSTCAFCKREFSDSVRPKLLPCLHNTCSECIATDCDVLTCPVCQELCPTNEIIDNYFFPMASGEGALGNGDGKEEQQPICTSCEESAPAESYCGDCGEWLCDACVKAHQRVRVTKDHIIRPRNEITGAMRRSLFCPNHRQELLKLFCQTCDVLTCRDCQLSDHRDHRYQFASEASARERKVFEHMLAIIDEKKGILENCKSLSEMRQADIMRCEKAIEEDIRNFIQRYIYEINHRGQEHLKHLRSICRGLRGELTQSHTAITDCLGRINHAMKFVQSAMQHDNDPAIFLHTKKIIKKQLDHIHKSQVNVPNPDLAMEFRFLDEPRFINAIRQMGVVSVKVQQPTMKQLDGTAKPDSNHPHGTKRPHPSSTSPHASRAHQAPSPSSQVSSTSSALTGMTKVLEKMLTSKESLPPLPPMPPPSLPAYHEAVHQRLPQVPNPGAMPQQQSPLHSQRIGSLTLTPIVPQHQMSPAQHAPSWGFSQSATLQGRPPYVIQQPQLQLHMQQQQQQQQQLKILQRQQMQQQYQQQRHTTLQQLHHQQQRQQQQAGHQQASHQLQFLSGGGHYVRRPSAESAVSIKLVPNEVQQTDTESKDGARRMSGQNEVKTSVGRAVINEAVPNKSLDALNCVLASIDKSMENGVMATATQSSRTKTETDTKGSLAQCSGLGILKAEVDNLTQLSNSRTDATMQNRKLSMDGGSPSTQNSELLSEKCPILLSTLQSAGDEKSRNMGKPSTWFPPYPEIQHRNSPQDNVDTVPQILEARTLSSQESDPNEDWCAVCHDGGDLLCCGKCPRVYHLQCHVPNLSSSTKEEDNWQCLMCRTFEELTSSCDSTGKRKFTASIGNISLKVCERILLELFCHEKSTPFHEPVSRAQVPDYYKVIDKPMDLRMVKRKLHPQNLNHYTTTKEFVQDIRQIFKNCFIFNPKNSDIHTNGKILEEFFEDLLERYIPEHAYDIAPTPMAPDTQEIPEKHPKKRKSYSHPFIHIR